MTFCRTIAARVLSALTYSATPMCLGMSGPAPGISGSRTVEEALAEKLGRLKDDSDTGELRHGKVVKRKDNPPAKKPKKQGIVNRGEQTGKSGSEKRKEKTAKVRRTEDEKPDSVRDMEAIRRLQELEGITPHEVMQATSPLALMAVAETKSTVKEAMKWYVSGFSWSN